MSTWIINDGLVLNEAFSSWSNVGHNEWINLVFLWIIPK
jgi:hypothetical protein